MVLLLLAVSVFAWMLWGNRAVQLTEIKVDCPGLPPEFDGYRVAQVSDLHNAEFGEGNAGLLAKLQQAGPDIIVLTGDLADSRRTNIDICLDFAAAAAEIAPLYYVSGNHEARIDEYPRLEAGLRAAGAVVLNDALVALQKDGAEIYLLGLSDPAFAQASYMDGAEQLIGRLAGLTTEADGFRVLLSHRPELFAAYAEAGVDLVFCGHAHGGQIRLPIIGGLFAPGQGLLPRYDAGIYQRGACQMVVSRGLGNSIFPLRVNNRPQVIVAELGAAA